MDHIRYLRDRSAEFANLAVATGDALASQIFHELSSLCREGAERLERAKDKPGEVVSGRLERFLAG